MKKCLVILSFKTGWNVAYKSQFLILTSYWSLSQFEDAWFFKSHVFIFLSKLLKHMYDLYYSRTLLFFIFTYQRVKIFQCWKNWNSNFRTISRVQDFLSRSKKIKLDKNYQNAIWMSTISDFYQPSFFPFSILFYNRKENRLRNLWQLFKILLNCFTIVEKSHDLISKLRGRQKVQ